MSANIYHPSRGGVRGGKDQFNWDDVKEDKDRENYLGHSVKAPVGRWQKGKDLMWYTRDKIGNESVEERKRKELESIRDLEAQAMATALGYKVPQKPIIKGDTKEVSNDIDKSTQIRDQKKNRKKKEKSKKKKKKQKRKFESSESDDSYNVRTQKSQKLDHSQDDSPHHKYARLKKKGRRGDDADDNSRAKSDRGDRDNHRSHSYKEEEERRGSKKGHRDRKRRT